MHFFGRTRLQVEVTVPDRPVRHVLLFAFPCFEQVRGYLILVTSSISRVLTLCFRLG